MTFQGSAPVEELQHTLISPPPPVDASFEEIKEVIYVDDDKNEIALPFDDVKSKLVLVEEKPFSNTSFSKSKKNKFCSEHIKSREIRNPTLEFSIKTSNKFEPLPVENENSIDEVVPFEEKNEEKSYMKKKMTNEKERKTLCNIERKKIDLSQF